MKQCTNNLHAWACAPEGVDAKHVCVICGAVHRDERTVPYRNLDEEQRVPVAVYLARLIQACVIDGVAGRYLRRDVKEVLG